MIPKGKLQFFGRFWILVENREFMGHLLRPGFLSGLLLLWVFVCSSPDSFSDEPPAEQNLELNSPLQQGNQGQRSMIRELRINFSHDISETLISSDLILMNLDQEVSIRDSELNFEINREELQAVWSLMDCLEVPLGMGIILQSSAFRNLPDPDRTHSNRSSVSSSSGISEMLMEIGTWIFGMPSSLEKHRRNRLAIAVTLTCVLILTTMKPSTRLIWPYLSKTTFRGCHKEQGLTLGY